MFFVFFSSLKSCLWLQALLEEEEEEGELYWKEEPARERCTHDPRGPPGPLALPFAFCLFLLSTSFSSVLFDKSMLTWPNLCQCSECVVTIIY